MVMKVGNINSVLFRGLESGTKQKQENCNRASITELGYVTPDYKVTMPQKYTKLGVQEISNGLNIHSYKLANGHRVTIIPMEGSPAVVKNYINVGSMNETDDIKGISHFLEHMAFNGTNGTEGYIKLGQGDSFKKIDAIGGWTNASTNYALTDYVNSSPLLDKEDLKKQLEIIAAMTEDLSLADNMIEKEKFPVSSEINMILDDPQTIAMDQTVRSLFNIRSSADELVGGSVNHIQNLKREQVKAYYDKYYTPDNMNLVITGDIKPDETIELVSKLFKTTKKRTGRFYEEKLTPIKESVRKDFITDKATSTEIIVGFAGASNNDTKSKILFEILSTYIDSSKTNLGKELKRLNTDVFLGREKIDTNPQSPEFIYYTLSCADEKSEEALKVIFDVISNLKAPSENDLKNIKQKLLQNRSNCLEYSMGVNDIAGKAVFDGTLDYLTDYEKILEEITVDDVENYIKTYFSMDKAAVTLVHPTTTKETINDNYRKASGLSFKGRAVNTKKVSTQTLNNNYEIAFQQTKNPNVYFDINLNFDIKNANPSVREVLREILEQNLEENSFKNFEEDNNIEIAAYLNENNLTISGGASSGTFSLAAQKAKELIKNPQISQEYLDEAVIRIKDKLQRYQDTAFGLYADNEAKTNYLYSSKADIMQGLDSVTLEDVNELYRNILENSRGIVIMNIPESTPELKAKAITEFSGFDSVKTNKPELANVYKANEKTILLTKARPVSQADIMQSYKFPIENTPKEVALGHIMNTLLSSSPSIGLFNSLREKERLAYTVYSEINKIGNCGELFLNILTTTDNKEIGEIRYNNVEKSICGFNRQITELLNSKYTDEDLESAKRILKANLINKEGVGTKLDALYSGLNSKYGIEYQNIIFDEIDSITREDVDKFSQKVFQNPPIYSIVASEDTLKHNKEFLDNLLV